MRDFIFLCRIHLRIPSKQPSSVYTYRNSTERKKKKTNVCPTPSGSKTGSQPNTASPRAETILPSVRPSKRMGSEPGKNKIITCHDLASFERRGKNKLPGPAEYANVQRAQAAFVGKPMSRSLSPWSPTPSKKYLMYGPGKPLSAAKQSAVSSVMHALPVCAKKRKKKRH